MAVPHPNFDHRNRSALNLVSATSKKSSELGSMAVPALIVLTATLLHLMRNITVLYFVFWILPIFVFVISWLRSSDQNSRQNRTALLIIIAFLYCTVISFYSAQSFGSPLIGISRFGFILPAILATIYGLNNQSYRLFILLWVAFALLAAISLPLQFVIGPISWFSESFERVGTARFGSLAGSLTTFGNIVGAALFIVLMVYRRPQYIAIAVAILILGAIASLQKAAFASIGISILTMLLARRLKLSTVLGLIVAVGAVGAIGAYFADYQTRGTIILLFETFTGTVDARQASDVSILQSLNDRIFELPVAAFNYYGADAAWTGIGVFGGSGSLGYPHLPHTHNLVGETILLFGLVPGMLIMLYLLIMLIRSFVILINIRGRYDENSVVAAGVLINITLPTIFAGALFYHPAGATIFWIALVYLQLHTSSVGNLQNRRLASSLPYSRVKLP